ncbi:cyclic lactone autoinducer peptide [Paenibacillaceae bacterium WGS1546]
MKKRSYHLIATVLLAFASLFVLTACGWWTHQPKVPQELLKR